MQLQQMKIFQMKVGLLHAEIPQTIQDIDWHPPPGGTPIRARRAVAVPCAAGICASRSISTGKLKVQVHKRHFGSIEDVRVVGKGELAVEVQHLSMDRQTPPLVRITRLM